MPVTRVAAIQMVSGAEVDANLAAAGRLIEAAVAAGARLIALPENFYLIGRNGSEKVAAREPAGDGPIQRYLAETARRHGIWLIGGTAPIDSGDPQRIRSACLVFDDAGRQVARYDKMHLFQLDTPDERYDEPLTVQAGTQVVALDSPFGRLGLSVCYDMRFPELYRSMGVCDVLFVPSAFTVPTGEAHWHALLRARAIENLAYLVAPAQGGAHPGGRRTYGHSLVIDPWGAVLAEQAAGEGVVIAELDTARIAEVRAALPALSNRRLPT